MTALGRLCCKSRKLQAVKIFGENLKREMLIRMTSVALTEVAYEFGVRR